MNTDTAPAEAVLGALPVQRKVGLIGRKSYTLVLTERRLIFALLTNAMLQQAAADAAKAAKENGAGFWSKLGATASVGFQYHLRYLAMAPEAILAENSDNFAVENSTVTRIEYRADPRSGDAKEIDRISIYAGENIFLETTFTNERKRVRDVLRQLFGARFR